jgi:hypothetical protein
MKGLGGGSVASSNPTLIADASTARTLGAGDANAIIRFTSNSDVTVAVPTAFSGLTCTLVRAGAGAINIVADAGVTIDGNGDSLVINGQFLAASILPAGTNAFDVIGGIGSLAALLAVSQAWTKGQAVTPSVLTDAATVAIDASASNNFTLTLTGNHALGAPSNLKDGQNIAIEIKQDATGGHTLTFDAIWTFPGGTAPTVSSAAGAADVLVGTYFAGSGKIRASLLAAFA